LNCVINIPIILIDQALAPAVAAHSFVHSISSPPLPSLPGTTDQQRMLAAAGASIPLGHRHLALISADAVKVFKKLRQLTIKNH
jgi:hypothetical protein